MTGKNKNAPIQEQDWGIEEAALYIMDQTVTRLFPVYEAYNPDLVKQYGRGAMVAALYEGIARQAAERVTEFLKIADHLKKLPEAEAREVLETLIYGKKKSALII